MAFTGTELTLGGTIITLLGLGGGVAIGSRNKVSRDACVSRHNELEKLLDAKIEPMKESLKRIEHKLDRDE
jgi:hypothetical protein